MVHLLLQLLFGNIVVRDDAHRLLVVAVLASEKQGNERLALAGAPLKGKDPVRLRVAIRGYVDQISVVTIPAIFIFELS